MAEEEETSTTEMKPRVSVNEINTNRPSNHTTTNRTNPRCGERTSPNSTFRTADSGGLQENYER